MAKFRNEARKSFKTMVNNQRRNSMSRALQQGESRTGTIQQGDRVTIVSDGIATKGDRITGTVSHFTGGSHQTVGYVYSGRSGGALLPYKELPVAARNTRMLHKGGTVKHQWRTTNGGCKLICLNCNVTYDCACYIDSMECLIHGSPHYQRVSLSEMGGCTGIKLQQKQFCAQM